MSDSEKWAWWTMGVLILTVGAYGTLVAFRGHGPWIITAFSLLALAALPGSSRRRFRHRDLDEREREIANKTLRAGFTVLWVALIGFVAAIGFTKGWDTTLTVPVWILAEAVWWAAVLMLGAQALTTIVLYRSGSHA